MLTSRCRVEAANVSSIQRRSGLRSMTLVFSWILQFYIIVTEQVNVLARSTKRPRPSFTQYGRHWPLLNSRERPSPIESNRVAWVAYEACEAWTFVS